MYLPQQYRLESPTSSCQERHPNDAIALLDGIPRLMIDSIPRPPLEYLLPEKPLSRKAMRSLHGRSSLLSSMEHRPTTVPRLQTTHGFSTSTNQVDNSKHISTPVRENTQRKLVIAVSTSNKESMHRSAVLKRSYKNVSEAPLSPPRVQCRWSAAAEDAAANKSPEKKIARIPRLPERHPSSDGLLQIMVVNKTRTVLTQRP